MNHDPETLQMVHNVALGSHDGIGMNQKKPYIIQACDGRQLLFTHPYIRFAPVLDMSTPKAHEP